MFQKKKEKSELPLPPQILSLGFQNSYVLVYDNLINTYLYTEIGLSLWISVFTNGRLDENTHFISLKVLTQCCSLKKKKKKLSKSQQEQPPDFCSSCAAALDADEPLAGLRFMSTMSSCFADESASSPGRDPAILRNRGCRAQVFTFQMFDQP
jgi:hypothetical protein